MATVFAVLGMIGNFIGILGMIGGGIAFFSGNTARGKELFVGGLIWFAISMAVFGLGIFFQRGTEKK